MLSAILWKSFSRQSLNTWKSKENDLRASNNEFLGAGLRNGFGQHEYCDDACFAAYPTEKRFSGSLQRSE